MRRLVCRTILVMLTTAVAAGAQAPAAVAPPALAKAWPASRLHGVLAAKDTWAPVPAIGDRDAWTGLAPRLRARLTEAGDRALSAPIAPLPASLFLDYARHGNRTRFEDPYFARRDRLHALVLAECVEDRGRFLEAIVDTAWAIAEESSWTIPAHQGAQRAGTGLPDIGEPIVDLFSAQTAHSVAWTLYLLGDRLDRVSPLVRPRLAAEVARRVTAPFEAREDFGWMGFRDPRNRPNNWNPWINSNVLAAALLLEPDPARRAAIVHKVLRSLDTYLGPHPIDGSCDEGPNYWGRAAASLFESLELLYSASNGRFDVYRNPVVADMGRFIYRARIAGTWFVNLGDSSPRVHADRALVFRYGQAIGDAPLAAFGSSGATEADLALDDRSLGRALFSLFGWAGMASHTGAAAPYPRDVWLPSADMQMMEARDREGTSDGWFVAAWGGHNAQSHNHNDVGNVLVFLDGAPVLIDVGRPTYTAQTFSARRYEIWAMQSGFHNLPTIGGQMQRDGREFAASDVTYRASDAAATLRMNIAPAYPANAGAVSWNRTVTLNRGTGVTVNDAFVLTSDTADVRQSFMTPCAARESAPGTLALTCSLGAAGATPVTASLRYDARALVATIEPIALDDDQLRRYWGERIFRIVLAARAPVRTGSWTTTIGR